MAYLCELGNGQHLYIDNRGEQTIVTLASSQSGQQQQSSSGFQTGAWTAPPQVFQSASGSILQISTAQGTYSIQIQGNSMGAIGIPPSVSGLQPLQMQQGSVPPPTMPAMPPIKPLEPLKMGNMQMSMNPMEMQMGNMAMRMEPTPASTPPTPTAQGSARRFCSQCGASVKSEDRFCSSCGHQLV
jgi:hypothetical protein